MDLLVCKFRPKSLVVKGYEALEAASSLNYDSQLLLEESLLTFKDCCWFE